MAAPKQVLTSKPALATAPRFVDKDEADALQRDVQECIAKRAYHLYEESGYQHGHDRQHWFQGESETLQQKLDVKESGSWVAVNGSLPKVSPEDVQIYVDPRRIVVRATQREPMGEVNTTPQETNVQEVFLVADLNVDVEPASASAALKNENLTLMVKKCSPGKIIPIEFTKDR